MSEFKGWKCPKCGDADHLCIDISTAAMLRQHTNGEFETEQYGDHEWGPENGMSCTLCRWVGQTKDAEVHEYEVRFLYHVYARVEAHSKEAARNLAMNAPFKVEAVPMDGDDSFGEGVLSVSVEFGDEEEVMEAD